MIIDCSSGEKKAENGSMGQIKEYELGNIRYIFPASTASANLSAGKLSLDIGFEESAVGRSGQEILINLLGDVVVLIDGTGDKLHLKHTAFVLITNPFDLRR
jgi:hypothetical protein